MTSYLYRFRPVDKLLGEEFNELRNQEIYFASPSEMNDPMEGFSDIFWQGDEIVWENLLRHYLVCLERAYSLLLIGGEAQSISWNHIPIVDPGDRRSLTPEHQGIHDEIFLKFFGEPVVGAYIEALATREGPIRRHELSMHIGGLHQFALLVISEIFRQHDLLPSQGNNAALYRNTIKRLKKMTGMIALLKQMKVEESVEETAIDTFFALTREMERQLGLIRIYNNEIDSVQANKNFVFFDFSEGYVNQIERIVYPEWYAACFMSDCRNSSIWGTYGHGHTGVCLRFKTITRDGRHHIALNRIHGLAMDGPIRGDIEHSFQEVNYSKDHVSVDFFRSLGRLPMPILNKYWYTSAKGKRSPCADPLHENESAWRADYWRKFEAMTASKLDDWRFENEYRLVLHSQLLDFSKPNARKIKYDFSALDGIIFGIRTPLQIKLDISKIIEQKCREWNRTDFRLFQAYYSREKGSIEHYELNLLKFAAEPA